MRMLALVTDGFGGFGGISVYNRQFLSAMAEGGWEITVLPRLGGDVAVPKGVHQQSPILSPTLYSASVLARLMYDRSFDLVWCGHIRMSPLAALAGKIIRCPAWLQIHGVDAWDPVDGVLVGRAVRQMALVTAVSDYTRERFLSWAKTADAIVKVVPNCVDDRFKPGPRRSDLMSRYGIKGGPILLTISRISKADREKGHERVIRALPGLRERFPQIIYLVGGDGDGRPRLEALARELSVAQSCRFIGKIKDEEMADHYRLVDVFVMPSTKEGFGIVYLEAMACGVPAVGLNVDGSVEPLNACSLGHAVPEKRLSETIATILTDEQPRPTTTPDDLMRFSRAQFGRHLLALAGDLVA